MEPCKFQRKWDTSTASRTVHTVCHTDPQLIHIPTCPAIASAHLSLSLGQDLQRSQRESLAPHQLECWLILR